MRGLPVLGLALLVGTTLGGCAPGGPVSDAEARLVASSLLSAAETAIAAKDDDRYCEIVAADAALCENSWAAWTQRGSPQPDFDTITVETESLDDGSQRLVFSGSYTDGEIFTSDVVVSNTGSGPRAGDPIFWVDR